MHSNAIIMIRRPQPATKVTAHIPLPLAEKVDKMATALERSRGWIMKQALSDWIDQEEDKFLKPTNQQAAAHTVQALARVLGKLLMNPRMGEHP